MKRKIKETIIGTVAIAFIVGLIFFVSQPFKTYHEDLSGEIRYVSYYSVNVREKPSLDAEIVKEKDLGSKVELTGNKVEYFMIDEDAVWYETTEGWIVSNALLDEWTYRTRFNKYGFY